MISGSFDDEISGDTSYVLPVDTKQTSYFNEEVASTTTDTVPITPPITTSVINEPIANNIMAERYVRQAWTWIFVGWGFGAIFIMISVCLGILSLYRLARTAQPITDGAWLNLTGKISGELGLKQPVVVLKSDQRLMPMTWGIFKPRLLLPEKVFQGQADRIRLVLLHELAHVKRWDYLSQLITRAVCGLYWFNPLVWIASGRMITEGERACDNLVLRSGSKPTDYAEQLLRTIAGLQTGGLWTSAAIAIARPSKLESRLRAILDPKIKRQGLTRTAVVASLVVATLAVLFIALIQSVPAADFSNKPTDISAMKSEILDDSMQAASAAMAERPQVVSVWPSDGAQEVEEITEIRIQFDRPMNPNMADLQQEILGQKGKFKYLDMKYDEDNNEFVFQVELEVNRQYNFTVNDAMFSMFRKGFCDREGRSAEEFKWDFRTRTAAVAGGPAPKVVSVSPGDGAILPVLSWVEVMFDQPMDPDSFKVVNYSSRTAKLQSIRRFTEYDALNYRFKLPVMLIPNWTNTITFKGFRSAVGVEAEEITLHYRGDAEEDPDNWLKRMEEDSRLEELKSILGEVKRRRMELRSLSMTVVIVRGRDGFESSSGIFKMQGEVQFFGDGTML
ncbi:M56 family metallopeptidase [Planctomycetota bacterium]